MPTLRSYPAEVAGLDPACSAGLTMRMPCAYAVIMKAAYNLDARKRAVNLSLNEDLL